MILNTLILGLSTGVYYSFVALGLVLVYKVSKVVNFAFGNMGMFMVYIALGLLKFGISPWMAFVLVLPIAALFGWIVDKFTMRPLRQISHGSMLIVTLGIMMILEGMVVQMWGADYKYFPVLVRGRPFIIKLQQGIVIFRRQDVFVFLLLLTISLLLFLILKYTKVGIAIRATSQDEVTASLMGVNTALISSTVWAISAAISTTVAIIGSPKTYVSPSMMLFYQLEGFTAAILGGFESFIGAIAGGLLLGVFESIMGNLIGEEFKATLSLMIVVFVLLIRPQGIFGNIRKVKV